MSGAVPAFTMPVLEGALKLKEITYIHAEAEADADTRIESGEGVHVIRVPEHYGALNPLLHVVSLQQRAYQTACARGADVDKPWNLAKNVSAK